MSTKTNDIWLEDMRQRFDEGDANIREAIIEELNLQGFTDEAFHLIELDKEDDLNYKDDYDK